MIETVAFFTDPAHWQGNDGIPLRVFEHLWITAAAVGLALALAVPATLWLAHRGQGGFLVVAVSNVGRALPALALIAFALPLALSLGLGLGFWPTLLAMIPLAIPAIVTNTWTAMREVDRDTLEAARGMGLSEWQVLWSVEWPLSLPLIVGGIRNAAVAVIATATLGALVAGGGLGRYIVDGLALQETGRLVAGAVLVALLAIAAEVGLGRLEQRLTPPGQASDVGSLTAKA